MSTERKPVVVLVQIGANRDGSTISGLMSADALSRAGWETHVVFGHEGEMVAEYEGRGHRVYVVPHRNWLRRDRAASFLKSLATELAAGSRIGRTVREVSADLVYVNTAASLAGVVAARRSSTPCLWHLRELYSDVGGELKAPRIFREAIRRYTMRATCKVVVNSTAVAANLLGGEASTAEVVPNAVTARFLDHEESRESARARLGLPVEQPVIGVPGTLRASKGHAFFLEVFARLAASRPSTVLAITGGGHEQVKAHLVDLCRRFELGERVVFLGSIDTMPSFYRACDLVAMPSITESFGRTVIEAFAIGAPVIASNVGGMAETIEHGHNGLLVEYGDHDAWGSALVRVLGDRRLSESLARAGKATVRSRFTEETYATSILTLARECAGV